LIRSRRLDGNVMAGLRSIVGGARWTNHPAARKGGGAMRSTGSRVATWVNSPDQRWRVAVLSFGFLLGG
jgi:hypothetical protein